MATCSNCGAESRAGSKFCTTCGTRLNEPASDTNGWGDSRTGQVDDTTQTAQTTVDTGEPADAEPTPDPVEETRSSWAWTTPAATDNASSRSSVDDPDEAQVERESDAASASDSPSTWTWGAANETGSGAATDDDPATTDPRDKSGSVFSWSWSRPAEQETETPPESTTAEALDAESVEESVDAAVGEDDPDDTDVPVDVDTELQTTAGDQEHDAGTERPAAERDDSLAAWSASWSDPAGPDPAELPAEEYGQPLAIGDEVAADERADADENDPRARATALLDELRVLIPQLGGVVAQPEQPAAPASPALEDLIAARSSGLGDTADLRRALETTRDSPRDVHSMIELVERVDDMIAVLDDRDRLLAAIDQATGNR